MKAKFVSKIFILFFCSLFFVFSITAQEKPQPVYVGEYQISSTDLSAFDAMTEQLALRLLREPETTRGFVGVYEKSEMGEKVKSILSRYPKLKNEMIYLNPKFSPRPYSWVMFWLVPQGAESPHPTICGFCVCPTLNVSAVESDDVRRDNLTFTANVEGGSDEKITYTWKVSAGRIVEGQGTPVIKVHAEGAKEIIATIEISGVCEECPREASFTTKIQ
jgi:hypothetical protein